MARTYLVFGDIEGKLDILRVECARCPHKGRYRIASDIFMRTIFTVLIVMTFCTTSQAAERCEGIWAQTRHECADKKVLISGSLVAIYIIRGGLKISCQACSSSSTALASFISCVSKPSVNQQKTGARRARACFRLAFARHSRA